MHRRLLTCPVSAHLAELAVDTDLDGRLVVVASCTEQADGGECAYLCVERINGRIDREGRDPAAVSCAGIRRVVRCA
jgi:hypothetical protein